MEIYQGMKINSHAGRLAGHLFAMVEKDEEGDLEGCAESLLAVNDAINGDHLLKMYLEDSTNSTADKKQTLEDLYDALEEEPDFYMDWAAVDMMELLIETKDLEALADVTADFNRMVLDYHGEIDCIVTSAEPLTEEQSQEAYNYISGVAGEDKAVLMEEVVDPSLLGGITIHLGDQFQDLSVRSALIAAEAALRAQ
jgi:ATP synthase F1 delta subunit